MITIALFSADLGQHHFDEGNASSSSSSFPVINTPPGDFQQQQQVTKRPRF